jgi:hypothetical protein
MSFEEATPRVQGCLVVRLVPLESPNHSPNLGNPLFVTLGYDVGIAFNRRRSWNRKRFAPKHLLEIPAGNCGGSE